jgi:hypothetical protein
VKNRRFWSGSAVCALALVVACSSNSQGPTSPSGATGGNSNAAADGTTLKVSAPAPQSPVNNLTLVLGAPIVLAVRNATPTFATDQATALTYKFEVYNAAGAKVYTSPSVSAGSGTTSHVVTGTIDFNQTFTWQARAEAQGAFGPWSPRATFVTPLNEVLGYVAGNELYDPLDKGVTIGEVHGPVQFVPGVGVKVLSQSTYISYQLPQTLVEGEISALVTNLTVKSRTEDPKDRVFTMREGTAAINDNLYRLSVDVRGNGAIAWRFLTGPGPYIETIGAERSVYPFHEDLTYFIRATYRGGVFTTQFREGGVNGPVIYNFGKSYKASYTPLPHNVYIGSPYAAGDRGEPASYSNMIIRQLWVSGRERQEFANK